VTLLLTDYRLQQRDYLLKIARAINSRLDLHEVLALVVRSAVELAGGAAGVIAIRDPSGTFQVAASFQIEQRMIQALQPLLEEIPRGLPAAGEPVARWEGEALREQFRQLVRRLPARFRQILALPLVRGDEIIGMLFVFRSQEATLFSPLDSELLESFADQAAIAIHNSNLYGRIAAQAHELQLLYDLSVRMVAAPDLDDALRLATEFAAEASASEWAAIVSAATPAARLSEQFVYDSGELRLEEGALLELETLSSTLFRQQGKRPDVVIFQEGEMPGPLARAGAGAAIAFPVPGRSQSPGVLWVARREPGSYGRRSIDLLRTFLPYLGLSMEKHNLIERLGARERQLSSIVEHNPAGVLLLDARGGIMIQNPVVQELTGYPQAKVLGRTLGEVLKLVDEQRQPVTLALPVDGETVTFRGNLDRSDGGAEPFVQVSITPLLARPAGDVGELEGFVANIVDLTALREAENSKRVFLAGLSHELKTPLALIRGYAEMLRYPQVQGDAELYEESLDVILEEVEHLTRMVDQLLQAARLQAGALVLDFDDLAPGPFVRKVVDTFRQAYPGFQWELELPEELPPIYADPVRLREVLHNLLSNAVMYSDPGSRIKVEARPAGDRILLNVSDEGIGIAAEDQAKLFRRFFRATGRGEGTGLGLYMARAIVEAHGGRITVQSTPGKGSVFSVELPRDARGTVSSNWRKEAEG
jgi:PAS domain S-box-containing protein